MHTIHFSVRLSKIGSVDILRIPKDVSAKLPSRGMVYIEGTINGSKFQTALEPDGKGSHWFEITKEVRKHIRTDLNSTLTLDIEAIDKWPEPEIPLDLKKALSDNPKAYSTWKDITPMARWDWIRWINSTKNPETRKKRILVTFSKFNSGKRRPCCFDRSRCTDPYISKNGILLD